MTPDQHFPGQKKFREAKFLDPENVLKKKAGSGGINPELLHKAQKTIDNNKVDFKPIADDLLARLFAAAQDIQSGKLTGEPALEAIIQPAMQIKSQGGMFHHPLLSEMGDILIDFLETVPNTDSDVMDIVLAHYQSMGAVLAMNADDRKTSGPAICHELVKACQRYHAKHGLAQSA